jgi:large subunit ribosomal protein L20
MARVKGGKISQKRRRHLLAYTKGYRWGRKSKVRRAKEAIFHAFKYAYRDRRNKKRDFKALWQTKISAACQSRGSSYSRFLNNLKKKNILLDRKMLSVMAENYPEIFEAVWQAANN